MNVYLDTKKTINVLYCVNKYKNNKLHTQNINQLKIELLVYRIYLCL